MSSFLDSFSNKWILNHQSTLRQMEQQNAAYLQRESDSFKHYNAMEIENFRSNDKAKDREHQSFMEEYRAKVREAESARDREHKTFLERLRITAKKSEGDANRAQALSIAQDRLQFDKFKMESEERMRLEARQLEADLSERKLRHDKMMRLAEMFFEYQKILMQHALKREEGFYDAEKSSIVANIDAAKDLTAKSGQLDLSAYDAAVSIVRESLTHQNALQQTMMSTIAGELAANAKHKREEASGLSSEIGQFAKSKGI